LNFTRKKKKEDVFAVKCTNNSFNTRLIATFMLFKSVSKKVDGISLIK